MNKVFNINLAGHLINIEEPAYEFLKSYIHQLEQAFHSFEEKDEIIQDIQVRIAELFSKKIKSGVIAIQKAHVEEVASIIGLPEELKDESEHFGDSHSQSPTPPPTPQNEQNAKKKLYRSSSEKIIGGVAGGLAEYFKIDPVLVRILFFIAATFNGLGVLIYIVLWAINPMSETTVIDISKRFYRDYEGKIIGGVCSGLSNYFDINVTWIRLIALSPFILSMLPVFLSNNLFLFSWIFSIPMFLMIYIILWIVIPYPKNRFQKAEMKTPIRDFDNYAQKIHHREQEEASAIVDEIPEQKTGTIWVILGILVLFITIGALYYSYNQAFSIPTLFYDHYSYNRPLLSSWSNKVMLIIMGISTLFMILIPIYFIIYILVRVLNKDYQSKKSIKILNIILIIFFILSLLSIIFFSMSKLFHLI